MNKHKRIADKYNRDGFSGNGQMKASKETKKKRKM